MTQVILDVGGYNIALPESKKGGYRAWAEDLSTEVMMVSGRRTLEVRGEVYRAAYQYGYFTDEEKNKVIAACRKGKKTPIECVILLPDGESFSGSFFVVALNEPKFMWSNVTGRDGEGNVLYQPMWADFSFELREVSPHA